MVSGHRVTNESHFLATNHVEEGSGVEPWKITLLRLPFPIEKISVHSPLLETVFAIRDCSAA